MPGLLGHGHPSQLRVPRNRVRFRDGDDQRPRDGTAEDRAGRREGKNPILAIKLLEMIDKVFRDGNSRGNGRT
jgi:hypothetical protein